MIPADFLASGNIQILENIAVIFLSPFLITLQLKEAPDHTEIQGFPEAPGSGKKIYLSSSFQKLTDHQRFVHIVQISVCDLSDILIAYRQYFFHAITYLALKIV